MSPPQALRSASSHSISVCPVVPPWSPAPGVHGDIIILLRSRTSGSCLKIPSLSGGKASAEPGVDKSRGFSVSLAQTVVRACLSCALYVSRMSSFVYVLVFVQFRLRIGICSVLPCLSRVYNDNEQSNFFQSSGMRRSRRASGRGAVCDVQTAQSVRSVVGPCPLGPAH